MALLAGCAAGTGQAPASATSTAQASIDAGTWWRNAVFYEIFVRSFYDTNGDGIGDLNGVTQKLDYLSKLGVNALWLMPINPSPSYHGYDVTDYYSINPQYGTMDDFKRLLSEAHKRGMHVIMDLVLNHTSSQHPDFIDASRGPESKYYNWYIWSDQNNGQYWHPLPGNPSRYYVGIFCDCMPDLNYRNPEVTAEAQKITAFWLKDVGVDGFRMDAIKHLIEEGNQIQNTPSTHQWLKGYYQFYKAQNPNAYAVGEVGQADASQIKSYSGGQLDQIFDFELAQDFVGSANTGSNSAVDSGLTFALQAAPDGNYATFLTNHDQDRVMSTLGGDVNKAKLAAFQLLTAPGTPFIYYGEEIGMQGQKPDEDIRRPMQWDASANGGFTSGAPWRAPAGDYTQVNVAAEAGGPGSLLSIYTQLIHLRDKNAALRTGQLSVLSSGNAAVYAVLRTNGPETVLVLANLQGKPISDYGLNLTDTQAGLQKGSYGMTALFGSGTFADLQVDKSGLFSAYKPLATIPAYGMYVLQLERP